MKEDEEKFTDEIIANARKIAESHYPIENGDSLIKEVWITGYISGYLNRVTEELIKTSN